MDWYPKLPFGEGPRYLQIVNAMQADIVAGRLVPGQRVPTHRELASTLDLSIGTVSKAYAAAERRGLISGEVGRGTFVLGNGLATGAGAAPETTRRFNLALNVPPATGEEGAIRRTLTDIVAEPRLGSLLGYLPHQGREETRRAVAGWLTRAAFPVSAQDVFITHGAQHAISIAMRLLARPGAPVLVENLTYSGMMSLSLMEGYALRGVLMDRHGLIPERLDAAFAETGSKLLYCTPTLQAATASVMPLERRAEIAEIVQRRDAMVIEDDAYGFLCPTPVAPLSSLLPDRSVYVVSFAKCLAPGLRIGAMVAPQPWRDRVVNAIRATGWMASPLMAEAVTRMIADGTLDEQVALKRAAAAERTALARALLGEFLPMTGDVPGFHLWLSMSLGRTTVSLLSQAAQAGLTLASPSPLQPLDPMANGFRLCLGGPPATEDLREALTELRSILTSFEAMAVV